MLDTTLLAPWFARVNGPIAWTEDGAGAANPYSVGYVDVFVPELCETYGLNWFVGIISPDMALEDEANDGGHDDFTIVLEPDLDVHQAISPDGSLVVEIPIHRGTPMDDGDAGALAAAAGAGAALNIRRGWSTAAVSQALSNFVAERVGVTGAEFCFDANIGPSPMALAAMEVYEAYASGAMATFDLGDGILVADSCLDELLAMGPDEAAVVTKTLKEVITS